MTIQQSNYQALKAIFSDFESNEEFYAKLESKGFMPLHLERIWSNTSVPRFSLMHTYIQNGDVMRDPDIEFELENGAIYCVSYRQDNMEIMREFDRASVEAMDADRFMKDWLRNIKNQGFAK